MDDAKEQAYKEMISHASGALHEIISMCSDTVEDTSKERLIEIIIAIHERALNVPVSVNRSPSWFNNKWEEEQFNAYLKGETKACASGISAINWARFLSEVINS